MSSEQEKKRQRLSLGLKQRAHLLPADKSKRASISTSSPSNSYAQKTAASNQKTSRAQSDQESNISVYVRCRSLNERELRENVGKVILTKGHMKKDVVVKTTREKLYTFDRVFGTESDQEMVFDGIAKNVVEEVLQGYNCTVFAYGQTGTGKTHTMSGDIQMTDNRLSENAGIIPRTLEDLFRRLEKNPEFTVKVSFIELYNEELRDLLLTSDSEERKVRIFEDPEKKTIVVQGMEETFIKDASEGMQLLKQGSDNRQVAATKCNDLSSRSHSVFTITVHMKDVDPISGEEYLKIGKLNLVDLAGSENISRSGAENKRAREAGMINQSLLTLGRVINALVDQSPHIPYRESKLTRLLQDSLGGRTKTCIIATISPARESLDETISTLEYANRAKSIKNKPQLNQTMSKKMLLEEYIQEIKRLRNDLNATRNKNGVYVSDENWAKVNSESENRKMQVEDQKLRIDVLEEKIRNSKRDFEDQMEQIKVVELQIAKAKDEKNQAFQALEESIIKLNEVERELKIETLVTQNQIETEKQLLRAHRLVNSTLEEVLKCKEALHQRIEKKTDLETKNLEFLEQSKQHIFSQTTELSTNAARLYEDNKSLALALDQSFQSIIDCQQSKIENKCADISQLGKNIVSQEASTLLLLSERAQYISANVESSKSLTKDVEDGITGELSKLKQGIMGMSEDTNLEISGVEKQVNSITKEFNSVVEESHSAQMGLLEPFHAKVSSFAQSLIHQHEDTQKKFNKEVEGLRIWQQSEIEEQKKDKQDLLSQISSLLEAHEAKRQSRFEEKLSRVSSAFASISKSQENLNDTFNSFMTGEWTPGSERIVAQFDNDYTNFKAHTECSIGLLNNLKNLKRNITEKSEKQCTESETLAEELHSKMSLLDEYISSVNESVGDGYKFTEERLRHFTTTTQDALQKIQDSFQKYGKALGDCKPQLIDAYINKQDEFMKSYKDATLTNVSQLDDCVQGMSYMRDDEPVMKRQKVVVSEDLPKSLPRHEIIRMNQQALNNIKPKMPLSEVDPNALSSVSGKTKACNSSQLSVDETR